MLFRSTECCQGQKEHLPISLSSQGECGSIQVVSSDAENSASVHWCQIKSWRQSWGELEKKSFIAFPGKGRHGRLLPLKTVKTREDLVRSFIAIVQEWLADKDQGVCRACTPLICSQVIS